MNDLNSGTGYHWQDGSPFGFLNWSPGTDHKILHEDKMPVKCIPLHIPLSYLLFVNVAFVISSPEPKAHGELIVW